MRKFRGKRKDNSEWVYGYYVQRSHKDCCVYHYIYVGGYFEDEEQQGTELEVYEVIPETIGQFTGLKSKSGIDIYGEDIIDNDWVVRFYDAHFVLCNPTNKPAEHCAKEVLDSQTIKDSEITGNIHRPELLEQK